MGCNKFIDAKISCRAVTKFSSWLTALMSSSSSTGSPTVCCRTFAASLEKKDDIWRLVRNSEIVNRRSLFSSFSLRISFATTSGSTFRPVPRPILNVSTKCDCCLSLKRYGFFICFKAQPSCNRSVYVEAEVPEVFGNVGILPTPSKRRVAYSVLARSRSVAISTDFEHLPKLKWFSSVRCRWNTRVQSSCGQLWVSSGLFAAAFSSGWDTLAGLDCLLSDLKSPFEKAPLANTGLSLKQNTSLNKNYD